MTDFNDFAAVAKDILFNYGADVIIAEHTRSGDLGLDKAITALVSLHEAVLRQAEEALLDRVEQEVIGEVPVAVTDLPTESEHGQLMERIRIRKDLKALRSERQAGTGEAPE